MIAFINIKKTKNVGDIFCTPYHYFSLSEKQHFHIGDAVPDSEAVIFGGGAINYNLSGPDGAQHKVNARRKIAWGIGASQHGSDRHPPVPQGFDLAGVREYGREGGVYVPCVSCMLSLFDAPPIADTEVVTFFNADSKIKSPQIPDFPTMQNIASIEATIAFLARGRTVITNSFHGAYWSLLMNRNVICIPYSSKFFGFKYPPTMATVENWKDGLMKTTVANGYLEECRYENLKFFKAVTDLIF